LLRGERVCCFQVGVRTESTPGVRLASMRFFLVGATSNIAVELTCQRYIMITYDDMICLSNDMLLAKNAMF